jgi:DNA-binding NarL/FixJ family response regulator
MAGVARHDEDERARAAPHDEDEDDEGVWPVTIRVLVADDQEMVRAGFRLILDRQDDMEVVADAGDGRTAVELARTLRPDVCLLDIRMPQLGGLEATRLLAGPGVADPIPVVVVTTFDLDDYVHQALRNGASGFLLKDAGPALLVEAVRAAARGDALVSPSVTVRLLQHFAEAAPSPPPRQPAEPLTSREEEVLRAVAQGRTNAELAAELFISLGTVKSHLANLHAKLGARNRVELAAWAWETGRMQPR